MRLSTLPTRCLYLRFLVFAPLYFIFSCLVFSPAGEYKKNGFASQSILAGILIGCVNRLKRAKDLSIDINSPISYDVQHLTKNRSLY